MNAVRRFHPIVPAVVLAGLAGCSPAPTPAPAPAVSEVRVAEDRSLESGEYADRGMPSPDRAWEPKDYVAAAKVLQGLARTHYSLLPRYHSPNSGTLFARITAADNFESLKDHSVPLADRHARLLSYLAAVNAINGAYLQAGTSGSGVFDSEAVELTGLELRLSTLLTGILEESLPTLSPTDPSYDIRMEELAKVRKGTEAMIRGAVGMFSETKSFRTEALVRLAGHLKATLPQLLPPLPKSARARLLVALRQARDGAESPDVRAALQGVLENDPPNAP